jgi:neutral ceramidase
MSSPSLLLVCTLLGQAAGADSATTVQAEQKLPWKAGAAVAKITPTENIWMAGYAARQKPSEGVAQDLFAKALALEDESGSRLVIVTMDLIGVRREVRENVLREVTRQFKLPAERLLLNASHTHCGPEYRPRPGREVEARQYQAKLEAALVEIIGKALGDLQPARLSYAHARCGFAMNRRQPLPTGYQNRPNSDGPVDHDVPVLAVYDADGKLRTVAFGYACHNTTLSSVTKPPAEPRYLINGDYAGFAQQSFQEMFAGSVAMFVNGCSGDQNPYPRHAEVPGVLPLELAEHHGRTLALAVAAGIQSIQRPITGKISAAMGEVKLTRNNDKPTHDYTAQMIRLGDDFTLVALSSETVVDYSLRLKREIRTPVVWIAGYSNDIVGYIPSRRVATEGGYEAGYDFTFDVEEKIIGLIHELAARLSVPVGQP